MLVTDRPLVSILTPTWHRHALLGETIDNVEKQTYPNLEHIIVSDGPDPKLDELIRYWSKPHWSKPPKRIPIRYVSLGRNWSTYLTDSYCAAPAMVAQMMAAGEYHSLLSDDERMTPDYIETMVFELERTGADFAYPRVAFTRWDWPPGHVIGLGADPPQCGSITTAVYRASLLDKAEGPYRTHLGHTSDWSMFERWIEAGARWTFVDRTMFSHRDDWGAPPERYAAPLQREVRAR